MSREHDAEREEQRLQDLFAAVQPPEALDARWPAAGAAPRPAGRLLGRLLVGAPGERRLRPLVAALLVPLLVLAAAGGVGLRARLGSGSGSGGPNPAARTGAAMAFDPAHGDVVMFGGRSGPDFPDDTWTWDGSGWTQQHPSLSPPPMASPMMAADPVTGRVLLVGTPPTATRAGSGEQTWSWDGSTWRQEHPAHPVPTVAPGAMAGDPVHHQVVVMVQPPPVTMPLPAATPAPGSNPYVHILPLIQHVSPPETWTWNGSDWSKAGASTPQAGAVRLAWEQQEHAVVMLSEAPACFSFGAATGGILHGTPLPSPAPSPMSGGAASSGDASSGPAVVVPAATPHALPISPAPPAATSFVPVPEPVPPAMVPVPAPACQDAGMTIPPSGEGSPSIACTGCQPAKVWTWDGSAWHGATLHSAPPFVIGDVVDDPSGGGVLVVSAGRSWTVTGSSVRSADLPREVWRSQAAMAGDPAHHDVVLFGGIATRGLAGDTWTWDGKSWTHRAGPVPVVPSPGVPLPAPVQIATPRAGLLAPSCGLGGGSFGGAHAAIPGDTSLTVAIPWPAGCSVTVTLLDNAGKPLDVRGNGQTLSSPGPELRFTWSNWCGPAPAQLQLSGKESSSTQTITPPGCANRSQPSILAFPPPLS